MIGFTNEQIANALQASRDLLSGARRAPLISVYHEPSYRQQIDDESMVAMACASIKADGASGEPHILPTFWPDFGTISTARLWCRDEMAARDGGGIHIAPAAQTCRELEKVLPNAAAFEESDFFRAYTLWRQISERLESDQIFLRTPDFQGPLNTLALVLEQTELMCALYEAPDLIEWALDIVTDVLIERIGRLRQLVGKERIIGNIWPYVILPDGHGVGVTQDYMPLLGPDMYEQFELPRLRRIAEAFGGVFIHCCGQYEHHFAALARADFKIHGLEIHYPYTSIEKAYEVFGDRVIYVSYVAPHEISGFTDLATFIAHLAGKPCAQARHWLATCHNWGSVATLKKAAACLGN